MNFKRFFLPVFLVCITTLLAITTVGFASIQATTDHQADEAQFAILVDKFFTNHYQGQVDSKYINSDDILIDSVNTYLWKKYSESRVNVTKIMAGGMRDYKYTIESKKAEFSGDDIANYYINLSVKYRYKDGADTPTTLYERRYRFIFQKANDRWLIGYVESNEDFYLQFKEFIKQLLPSPASEDDYRRTVDIVLQKVIQQAQILNNMFNEKNEQEKIEREKKIPIHLLNRKLNYLEQPAGITGRRLLMAENLLVKIVIQVCLLYTLMIVQILFLNVYGLVMAHI